MTVPIRVGLCQENESGRESRTEMPRHKESKTGRISEVKPGTRRYSVEAPVRP